MQKGNTAKAMLTDEAFRAWCQRNQIAQETETYIDGAGFEEWKPADALDKLAVRMTERYQREDSGGWRCPPGEATAQALGLSHHVRTSNEYHPFYIQNLKFLQDFWTHPLRLEAQAQAQVLEALRVYPGVSVPVSCSTPLASPLIFDGRLWEAEIQNATVVLRPEVGAVFTLTTEQFQRLVDLGHIKQGERATPSPLQDAARERLVHAGPKALEAANRRWREILAYITISYCTFYRPFHYQNSAH